ncbi:class I SAM-dependent methyltransferase [bacterium]|nr:class I SAM-dependent methyltransferase [bacterium]
MQKTEWNNEFLRELKAEEYPKYPNEAMLKVIFGSYLRNRPILSSNMKVLDVGCAMGSNLIPFADMGCDVHGIDIHPDISNNAKKIMKHRGYEDIDFKEGSNRNIPFPDNSFDLITSINTLHYEKNEEDMILALNEFQRVLKPGGGLYISTVGPKHEIYNLSKPLGNHENLIQDFGFRSGERFFFFDNERYLDYYLSKIFTNVETGRVTEKLMTMDLDFLISYATKPLDN